MHYHGKSGSQYKRYLILVYNKLFNSTLRKIDAIICDSLFERELIIKNFSYSQDKIFVIPPGYDLDRILKHNWNPANDGFKKILYVGRIVRHKNVHELVRSLKLINNAKLTIIGTGNYEDQIMELIRVNDLSKSIQWKKNLKYDELLEEYCKADIFVLPSIYEAFGIVVGEAALIGCPIIVADSYALKEFVNGGLAKAVTVPIDHEKLAELINEFHAESPRNKAVNYFKDWSEISEKYKFIYKLALVSKKNHP
jgi:glycosyltransferase involved in cell wall biosynthesis